MKKYNMKKYIGTKSINAEPMSRGDYNKLRSWTAPEGEDQTTEGYLVEYPDSKPGNHADYDGYISWSPKDVFQKSYRLAETYLDRLLIESIDLTKKIDALTKFLDSNTLNSIRSDVVPLMREQLVYMRSYSSILQQRIRIANMSEA